MDLARLIAVDVHVHVEADHDDRMSLPEDVAAASAAYFGASPHRPTVDEIAACYRERRIGAVVFTKYFPPQLVRCANSLLQDKVMFGSDYPLITPDRWLEDFGKLDIRRQARPKILKDNAVRVLNLSRRPPQG
jgi:hypothetical protein